MLTWGLTSCSNSEFFFPEQEEGRNFTQAELGRLKALEPLALEVYKDVLGIERAAEAQSRSISLSGEERMLLEAKFDKILQDEFGDSWTKYVDKGQKSTHGNARDGFPTPIGEDGAYMYYGWAFWNWVTYPWSGWHWMTVELRQKPKAGGSENKISGNTLIAGISDEVTPYRTVTGYGKDRVVADGNTKWGWFPSIANAYGYYEIRDAKADYFGDIFTISKKWK